MDPLLTIEEATREFRVSPKTIRRRLAADEIAGAYKRPGSRGPEWVMPRSSLEQAGFIARTGPTAEVPEDPEARSEYWARRAADAEAALEVELRSSTSAGNRQTGPLRWVGIATVAAALAILAVVVLRSPTPEESPTEPDLASDVDGHELRAVVAMRAVLDATTGPSDNIGVLGQIPPGAVPGGRPVTAIVLGGPNQPPPSVEVVVAVVPRSPTRQWRALAADGTVLLRVPTSFGSYQVVQLDRRSPSTTTTEPSEDTSPAVEPAGGPSLPAPSTTTEPISATTEAPVAPSVIAPVNVDAGGVGPAGEASSPQPGGGPATAEASPAPPASPSSGAPTATVTVGAGASFWSVAADVTDQMLGRTATPGEIAPVWAALVEHNRDRLVNPGNPDLLLVGQVLALPPIPG